MTFKSYVVFDANGEITLNGSCQEQDFEKQGPAGFVLEGVGTCFTHYVCNNIITPYSDEQAVAKRTRPNYPATWSNTLLTWVDERDLASVKHDKWTEIRGARDMYEGGGFSFDSSVFDSDPQSQMRIQGAVQLAMTASTSGQPFEIDWTLQDNTVRTLSGAEMQSVGLALAVHVGSAHAKGRALRAALEEAQTAAEVQAVVWQ